MECQHEVPCTCSEYLNRLTEKQLINLRIQYGRVITNGEKAISMGVGIPIFVYGDPKVSARAINKEEKKEAILKVKRINQILEDKFGYVII